MTTSTHFVQIPICNVTATSVIRWSLFPHPISMSWQSQSLALVNSHPVSVLGLGLKGLCMPLCSLLEPYPADRPKPSCCRM